MNFSEIYQGATEVYCNLNHLPKPQPIKATSQRLTPFISNDHDDEALEALTDEYRIDLLDQLRSEESTKFVIHEHDLQDGDLLPRLITIAALWNDKPDTAYERMKLIDQLLYDTAHNIAERLARKDLDL